MAKRKPKSKPQKQDLSKTGNERVRKRQVAATPNMLDGFLGPCRTPKKEEPRWKTCCVPKGKQWNAACKYRRRDHKKRYPNCRVPDQVADVIAR